MAANGSPRQKVMEAISGSYTQRQLSLPTNHGAPRGLGPKPFGATNQPMDWKASAADMRLTALLAVGCVRMRWEEVFSNVKRAAGLAWG
jgi:hypothetical protein